MEGGSRIKMTGVLVVLFKVQNLEIDTFYGAKSKMTAIRIIVVPLKVSPAKQALE